MINTKSAPQKQGEVIRMWTMNRPVNELIKTTNFKNQNKATKLHIYQN